MAAPAFQTPKLTAYPVIPILVKDAMAASKPFKGSRWARMSMEKKKKAKKGK